FIALNNHRRMGHHDHSCRTGRQALRIRVLGMVDGVIPLLSKRSENHLLSRHGVPRKIPAATSKPDAGEVRVRRGRLSYSPVPPCAHVWRRFTWCSPTLCVHGNRNGRKDQETQHGRNDRIHETTSHFDPPKSGFPSYHYWRSRPGAYSGPPGPPSSAEPPNTRLPPGNITVLPFTWFDPFLARKPSHVTVPPLLS